MPRDYQPGDPAPERGDYEELDAFGVATGRVARLHKGDRMPGAPSGFTWRLIPKVSAALRMAIGPILSEGATSMAAPVPPAASRLFSPKTNQLLRDAWHAIEHATTIQKWCLGARRLFDIRD